MKYEPHSTKTTINLQQNRGNQKTPTVSSMTPNNRRKITSNKKDIKSTPKSKDNERTKEQQTSGDDSFALSPAVVTLRTTTRTNQHTSNAHGAASTKLRPSPDLLSTSPSPVDLPNEIL